MEIYTQIQSWIKQVGLSLQLQLTIEQLDVLVDLSHVLFEELFHVCSNSNVRETITCASGSEASLLDNKIVFIINNQILCQRRILGWKQFFSPKMSTY